MLNHSKYFAEILFETKEKKHFSNPLPHLIKNLLPNKIKIDATFAPCKYLTEK
jgi:hypothetical protein